jgi:RES domain-containing protein
VLTAVTIAEPASVRVLLPDSVPNPNWLRPGIPSAGQQTFGDELLAKHKFVLIPSAVSTHSWNLIFTAAKASGAYTMKTQERFALDPRLHPPSSRR